MNFTEYQREAASFINKDLDTTQLLANAALGVAGEAGEVADLIKKHLYQGHDLDVVDLSNELGDVMWYVAMACTILGIDLSRVAVRNINKLTCRYPEGFSCERSVNRVC